MTNAGAAPATPYRRTPEIMVTVKPIAGLLTESRIVPLAVAIDGAGGVVDCAPARAQVAKRLVDAACAQAKAQWIDMPLEDPEGTPRAYVRTLNVAFVPEDAAP